MCKGNLLNMSSDTHDEKAILPEQEQLVEGLMDTDQCFCSMCLSFMQEPAQMFMSTYMGIENVCEHVACKNCLSTLKKNNCPICAKPFNITIRMILIEKLINRQKITCKHTGCDAIFKIQDAKAHYKVCLFDNEKCKHCNKMFIRKDIAQHIETCEYRFVPCEVCKKDYVYIKKEEHIKMYCPETVIKCRHDGCDAEAPRVMMKLHEESCDHRPIGCPFACGFTCKPAEMEAKHLALGTCPNQLISCDNCDVMTNRCRMAEHHRDSCPMIKILCDGCGYEDVRRNMDKHYEVCKEFKVKCPKCNMKIARKDIDKHSKEKQELHKILESPAYKNLDIAINGNIIYLDEGKELKCTIQNIIDGVLYLNAYKSVMGTNKFVHFEVNLEKEFKNLSKHDPYKLVLIPGMKLDVEDREGMWEPAIIKKIVGENVHVHYLRWDPKYDEVVNLNSPRRFANLGTHRYGQGPFGGQQATDYDFFDGAMVKKESVII